MTRVGAIDIGTNSTRLLVADVDDELLVEIARRSTVTRLGEGVDAGRRLQPEPIARVKRVLEQYRRELDAADAYARLAVATSAVRDATNGGAFMHELETEFGFSTRILSGDEEAQLTRRGVGALEQTTLLLDVGGGSTELILGDFRTSIDVGSVRLSERFLHGDPPAPAELAAASEFVRGLLPALAVEAAIGVAGTVTQLHERIGELRRVSIEDELRRLVSLPLAERARLPRMDPLRAPVIIGGAIIVREVLNRYGLEQLGWSVRDLLDGAAFEAARLSAAARLPVSADDPGSAGEE